MGACGRGNPSPHGFQEVRGQEKHHTVSTKGISHITRRLPTKSHLMRLETIAQEVVESLTLNTKNVNKNTEFLYIAGE